MLCKPLENERVSYERKAQWLGLFKSFCGVMRSFVHVACGFTPLCMCLLDDHFC